MSHELSRGYPACPDGRVGPLTGVVENSLFVIARKMVVPIVGSGGKKGEGIF